jgi:hypothetical protein
MLVLSHVPLAATSYIRVQGNSLEFVIPVSVGVLADFPRRLLCVERHFLAILRCHRDRRILITKTFYVITIGFVTRRDTPLCKRPSLHIQLLLFSTNRTYPVLISTFRILVEVNFATHSTIQTRISRSVAFLFIPDRDSTIWSEDIVDGTIGNRQFCFEAVPCQKNLWMRVRVDLSYEEKPLVAENSKRSVDIIDSEL